LSAKTNDSKKDGEKKKPTPPAGVDRALLCARATQEKKAEDLVVLNIGELSGFADYFVICSGVGELHVRAIAGNVYRKCREAGVRVIGEEGKQEGNWVVLDCGDVVIHVFEQSIRGFYDLERLWIHADEIEVPEE